jgi:glycopeptide antibiotics resistance protein
VRFGAVAFVLICVSFAVVHRFVSPRLRLLVWTLIVAGGVVPWSNWSVHPHLDHVEWIPFSRNTRIRDIVLNVLFYLPVGYFHVSARTVSPGMRRVLEAGLIGLGLSVVTEASQIFSHGRFPAATDVLTNTTGAMIGGWLARSRGR